MSDTITPSTTAWPYADRAENEYPGDGYSWFIDMLRGRDAYAAITTDQVQVSTVRIVNKLINSSGSYTFDAFKGTDVSRILVEILSQQSPDTQLRQVIVQDPEVRDLDFTYIEAIGTILKIDPLFFVTLFERSRAKDVHALNAFRHRPPSMLPLESKYLQFSFDSQGHITLMRSGPESSRGNIGSLRF